MKGGQWVNGNSVPAAGDRTYEEYNPATGELIADVAKGDALGVEKGVQVAERTPVVVTVNHSSTRLVVRRAKRAEVAGASAVMALPPFMGHGLLTDKGSTNSSRLSRRR